jgi:hypothetical protein
VNWLAQREAAQSEDVQCAIGWDGLENVIADLPRLLAQLPITVNENDLTEWAAIGVMAVLIHHLENAELQTVLPIGSGADYIVQIAGGPPSHVEVSGIREADTGSHPRSRLAEKTAQVLRYNNDGFASVTTFAHGAPAQVHSYLHHVTRPPRKRRGKAKKR